MLSATDALTVSKVCGCATIDWTGCFSLQASNLEHDINAPPDVMAVYDRKPLSDLVQGFMTHHIHLGADMALS